MKQQRPSRLERKKAKFEEWQKQNPSKTFKDYFTQNIELNWANGKPHPSLGGNLGDHEYATAGR